MKYLIIILVTFNAFANASTLTQMSEQLYKEGFRYEHAYSDITENYESIISYDIKLDPIPEIKASEARAIIHADLIKLNQNRSEALKACGSYFQKLLPIHLPNLKDFFGSDITEEQVSFEFVGKFNSCSNCPSGFYNLQRDYVCRWSAQLKNNEFNQKYFIRENWTSEQCEMSRDEILKISFSEVLVEWKSTIGQSRSPHGPGGDMPLCIINLSGKILN